MNPKSFRVLAVCLTVGAGVWCWRLLTMEADGSRTAGRVPAAPVAMESQPRAAAAPVKWPDRSSPKFKRMAGERAQPWLEARGRDAAGLVAMWDLTGDEALLKEAAEKFPNDPRVCMAMISHKSGKASDALPWVERLIAAEPKNPHGYHLKAWVLIVGKDSDGAVAALSVAAGNSSLRNTHAAERAATVREAALSAGMSPGNAARMALESPFNRMLDCRVGGSVNRAIMEEVKKAQLAGEEKWLMEVTGLGLTIAESMRGGTATVTGERFANRLNEQLLEELPDDTEIGAEGKSVRALRSEVEARQEGIEEANRLSGKVAAFLRTGSDEEVAGYADCFIGHGERMAMSSLVVLGGLEEGEAGTP